MKLGRPPNSDYTEGRGMAHYIAETLARFDVNLVRVQPIAQKE